MANIRKISYLSSVKSGEDLGKQLVVVTDEGGFFQSYNTIIAKVWSVGKKISAITGPPSAFPFRPAADRTR